MNEKLLFLLGYTVDPAVSFAAPPEDHRQLFVDNVIYGRKQSTLARQHGVVRNTVGNRIAAVRRWLLEEPDGS